MIRPLILAIALLAIAAPAAAAHGGSGHFGPPDAEIFATDNTALITDQHDPRLRDRLGGFARKVTRIVRDGGGRPDGSQLLDGVFFSSDLGGTTFERSRAFAVDRVGHDELHDIAETIRRRFLQESVLTFDHLSASDPDADAIELEVPHVTARALRDGLLADPVAQERLFGGSVTLDGHLLLVAGRADADLAHEFAKRIGGDTRHAVLRYGEREFVEVATDGRARIEKRTLVLAAGDGDDFISLHDGRRVQIDFGDDGVVDFEVSRHRFDRVRVDGSGSDRLILVGTDRDDRYELSPGAYAGAEVLEVRAGGGDDSLTVDDLSAAGVQEVDTDLGAGDDRVVVNSTDEDEQSSILGFGDSVFVLAATFVFVEHAETADRLRLNGRGGNDLLSTSADAMKITLDGGSGGGTLLGGPGDDVLIGGNGFDDVKGGQGDDVAYMGADFDRFSWAPGDGSDEVHGGASNDSLFFLGSDDAERFDMAADGRRLRFTRDVGNIVMDLDDIEEIDAIAFGGADVFHVGDVRGTGVKELNPSLAPSFGAPGGDGTADRVEIDATQGDDAVTVTGQTVVSGAVTVTGLPVKLGISHSDGLLDTLAIHTLGGDDTVDSKGLEPNTIGLTVD